MSDIERTVEQHIRALALANAVASCGGADDKKYLHHHADNVIDVACKYEEYITEGRVSHAKA